MAGAKPGLIPTIAPAQGEKMTFLKIFIGFVLAIVVGRVLHVGTLYGIGIVGGIWLLQQMPAGSAGGGITGAVRGIFGFFWRLLVGAAVFVGLMMLVSRVTGVPFGYVTGGFEKLGWAFWRWPGAHFGWPMLVTVSAGFLAAWAAMRAAEGRPQVAGWIFGLSTIIIFMMMWMPRTAEMARPKPARPTTLHSARETQAWADADQAVAERGVVRAAIGTVWRLLAGPPAPKAPDLKKRGVVGSGIRRTWRFLFGEGESERATRPPAPAPPAPAPPAPPAPRECSTPCALRVEWDDRIWTGGRPVQIKFYREEDWVLLPSEGRAFTLQEFSPGEAQFVSPEEGSSSVLVQVFPAAK